MLILGGGEGATLREVLRCPDVARCTMVDIDALVVELSKKYLPEWSAGAFDDAARARDRRRCARSSCARAPIVTASIVSDLTEPLEDSPSNPLFNDDVFTLIKSRLAEGGIYVLQASTAAVHNAALHCKMARTLRRHYAHVVSFFTHVPAFDTDWAFLACSDRIDLARLDAERDRRLLRAAARRELLLRLDDAPAALLAAALPAPHAGRRRGYVLGGRKATNEIMSIDYSRAPRAWEKEQSNFVALLDLKLEERRARQGGDAHALSSRRSPTVPARSTAARSSASATRSSTSRSRRSTDAIRTRRPSRCSATFSRRPGRRTISSRKRECCAAGRRIVYGEVYVRSGEKIVAHATLDFLNSYPEEKPRKRQ